MPIVLADLDYNNKVGGIGQTIYPCGDFESDMAEIREFYKSINGMYPELGSFVDRAEY